MMGRDNTRLMRARYGIFMLFLLSAAILMASGCTGRPGGGPESPGQDTITGSWLYAPPDDDQVRELYIFKDNGRFDATRFRVDPSVTLPYELYATGSWNRTGGREYLLAGNAIYHYFSPDSHASQKIGVSLTMSATGDVLSITGEPENRMVRVSHDPVIPAGLNISFPFD